MSERDNDDSSISSAVRELCNHLRSNDFVYGSFAFVPSRYIKGCSESESTAVLKALEENTTVKHINFSMLFKRHYSKRFALVAAEYVKSSKTLQTLDLGYGRNQENTVIVSHLLQALSRNTSVAEFIIHAESVRCASGAFQELLTCTRTIQKLTIICAAGYKAFDQVQIAAIASGFANNTTLWDLELNSWQETDLAPVLTALHSHPALRKVHLRGKYAGCIPSLSALEVLLRSQDSNVKEVILDQVVDQRTVGFQSLMQELGRNTTVTNLSIRESVLSPENAQQLKAALRLNTTLQHLSLRDDRIGSAGLAEIALGLYRNTSIKSLDLSHNILHDVESANVLRELIRHNHTITSLCIANNFFGGNTAMARIIFEGVRSNTALRQLELNECALDNRDVSLLANALLSRNTSILELDLHKNKITSVGVRALVEDNAETMKTLTKLRLSCNHVKSEGATILADALGRNAMPSLKRLHLGSCGIEDDGLVALVSALEQNTSLQMLDLKDNHFGERGVMALAKSLPSIKGLQQINFWGNTGKGFKTSLHLLLEGFRKNTSLLEVIFDTDGCVHREWSQELQFLGQRNQFAPLLKALGPLDASSQLGIWPRALAKVVAEPDVLFHVLCNKPKLVGVDGGSNKRKRKDE